jgi:hypothetical protein
MSNTQKPSRRPNDDWVTPLLERTIQLIAEWPAMAHICVAGILTSAFFWFYAQKRMSLALIILIAGVAFACRGITSLYRDWRYFRAVEQFSKGRTTYRYREMEHLITGIYHLQGYKVRSTVGNLSHLSRQDVDLVAKKGKEIILIQFNHWNEDALPWRSVEAPHRAALELNATGVVLICFGRVEEVTNYANLKEIHLLTHSALSTLVQQYFFGNVVKGTKST